MNPDTPYKGLLMFHGVGTGKCVLPETKVYINDEIMNIENVWKKYSDKNIINDNENGIWSNTNINLYTTSLNINSGKIEKGLITKLYK